MEGLYTSMLKHDINAYYEKYHDHDITFNKDVISLTGIKMDKVALKLRSEYYNCILFSSSLSQAKIILQVDKNFKDAKLCSLRLAFRINDNNDVISFFIDSKIAGLTPFKSNKPNVFIITLEFNTKPPDDFIIIVGRLLDTNVTANKRREERITLDEETKKKLGLEHVKTSIFCDGHGKQCIIKDISFNGSKVIVRGTQEDYLNKRVMILLNPTKTREVFEVLGTVVRCDVIDEKNSLIALALSFDIDQIPMSYKLWLTDFFKKLK